MIKKIRTLLWRILGINYSHILKDIDHIYLKEDNFTSIGEYSYDNNALVYRWSDAPLVIGKYCSISYGVRFILDDGRHQFNRVSNYPFKTNNLSAKRSITLGNDVWVGMNAIIMNGVKIGNGVTIAAGAVVIQDVDDYCIVGGVPAKVINRKCSKQEAIAMSKIAWWDWSPEKISERINDFHLDISSFVSKFQ